MLWRHWGFSLSCVHKTLHTSTTACVCSQTSFGSVRRSFHTLLSRWPTTQSGQYQERRRCPTSVAQGSDNPEADCSCKHELPHLHRVGLCGSCSPSSELRCGTGREASPGRQWLLVGPPRPRYASVKKSPSPPCIDLVLERLLVQRRNGVRRLFLGTLA